MSQLVLDDQLDIAEVLPPLQKWFKVQRLRDLCPDEHVLDERIPQILRTLKQPTFVTIDEDFWDRRLCHRSYAIIYFALRDNQQKHLPGLLRSLFRLPPFRSRARRMGKVVRVSATQIAWHEFQAAGFQRMSWKGRP